MRQRTRRNAVYHTLNVAQIVAIGGATFIGVSLSADVATWKSWSPLVGHSLSIIQNHAWWLLIVLGAIAFIAKPICAWLGPPWVWSRIESLLDEVREHAFDSAPADAVHDHRVTLFKRVGCCLFRYRAWRFRSARSGKKRGPFAGWIIPVARSGHTAQKTDVVFLAPDHAEDAEGIAGQVWRCNKSVYLDNLPRLTKSSAERTKAQYAAKTWVSPAMVQRRLNRGKLLARSFCGIPIEVKSRFWGAIVLDSVKPQSIKLPNDPTYRLSAKMLGELLRRS